MVDLLAEGLLGRHVGDGADRRARARQVDRGRLIARIARRAGMSGELGQAKVEHLRVSRTGNEDVGGLDVAMDDPFCVRLRQRLADLHSQLDHPVHRHRLAADRVLERLPLEQLHSDERRAVVLADLVDGADVGVVERRRRARLAQEALERRRVLRHLVRQELERHLAAEVWCPRRCRQRPCHHRRGDRGLCSERRSRRSFVPVVRKDRTLYPTRMRLAGLEDLRRRQPDEYAHSRLDLPPAVDR